MRQNQSIKKQLNYRFSLQNVCHEHYYIQRMNMKMQITTNTFLHDPKLKNSSKQQILDALSTSHFFKPVQNITKTGTNVEKYKLEYPDSDKTIIVTGINKDKLKKFIEEFQPRTIQKYKKPLQSYNMHWSIIKLATADLARQFKKSFREKKKNHDLENDLSYKIDKKRVRIIILNEDFFTILIDAMNQTLNDQFMKNFGKENKEKFIYQKINFRYQDQYVVRTQEEYEDAYSEEKSITTQSHDYRNLDDYIEKTDTGIQACKIQESTHQNIKSNQEINIQHHMKKQIGVGTSEDLKKKPIPEIPNLKKNNKKKQTQIVEIVQTGIMIQTQEKQNYNEHMENENNNQQPHFIELQSKKSSQEQFVITLKIQSVNPHSKQNSNRNQQLGRLCKETQLVPQNQILKTKNQQKDKRKQYQYTFIRKLQRKIDINCLKYDFKPDIPNYLLKQSQKQLHRKKWFTALQNEFKSKKRSSIWKN